MYVSHVPVGGIHASYPSEASMHLYIKKWQTESLVVERIYNISRYYNAYKAYSRDMSTDLFDYHDYVHAMALACELYYGKNCFKCIIGYGKWKVYCIK